jgi:hypothetical protein
MHPTQSTQVMTFAMLMDFLSKTLDVDQVDYIYSYELSEHAQKMTALQMSKLEKMLKPLALTAWKAQKALTMVLLKKDVSYLEKKLSQMEKDLTCAKEKLENFEKLEKLEKLQAECDRYSRKFSASDSYCGGFTQLQTEKDLLCAKSRENLSEDEQLALTQEFNALRKKLNNHSLHWDMMVCANGDLVRFIDS